MSEKNDYRSNFFTKASELGWEVVFEDKDGIQLKRRRIYSEQVAIAGLLLLVFAVGLIVWVFGYIQYLARADEIIYIKKHDLLDTDRSEAIYSLLERKQ